MASKATFEGAMTAIVTPFRNGAPDYAAFEKIIDEQIAAGIDGIVAVGTTGESATINVDEHLDVIKQCVKFVGGRVPVIAGAGGNSTQEAIELSRTSEKVGAEALLQVTPYYNKPTQEGLFRHFEAISKSSALPIILYNVPGRTSCDMQAETVARLAELPTIVAIKEASGDMRRASEILQLCGDKITLLSGDDFTTFPLLCLGGRGVISVVSNIMPEHMVKMCKAANAGDIATARKHHFAVQKLCALLFCESNPIPVKAAMALLGKLGPELRLPLTPASDATVAKLRAQLHEDGLL